MYACISACMHACMYATHLAEPTPQYPTHSQELGTKSMGDVLNDTKHMVSRYGIYSKDITFKLSKGKAYHKGNRHITTNGTHNLI